jgi:serine/threonine protein phosphatase PrpC
MKVQTTSFGLAKDPGEPSQDAFAVRAWGETVIAAVADGVGGARAGGEAAQRAVEALVNSYAERPRAWAPLKALGEFTRLANQRLFQDSAQRYGGPEMVSTLSVAVIEGDRLFGLNIGDSRIYLARDGKLEQLSTDHVLDGAERRHVLSRALGLSEQIQPEYFERELRDGDVTLLCTDGLTGLLDDPTLGKKLAARASARSLVSAARERATPELLDDISAVVLDITETGKLRMMSELPLPIPEKLSKGDVIDGFTLVKAFQHTGDRVWIATRDEARYTLKFAPVEAHDNEPLLNAFIKETWNATRISSPAFVQAFVPEEATARYYAMEFVEAPNLKTLLRSRRLAIDEAIALGAFLLKASQELLRLDLVHGDLKPENILVLSAYDSIEFKLVDFGSVTELFSIRSRAGTASYLAPERFRESPISERTEIFAIGVTLYESLTGAFPHGEVERFQTPQFAAAKDPAPLNRNIAPWLRAVLLRATAPQPERRYQNFSEMLYDLQHPEQVEPFHRAEAGLIERNPLRFYRAGFFVLLVVVLILLGLLLASARACSAGRAGVSPAVSGVSPETPPRTRQGRIAHQLFLDDLGETPRPAGGTPALPNPHAR